MNFLAHYWIATRTLTAPPERSAYAAGNALPDLLPLAAHRVRLRPVMLPRVLHASPDDQAMMEGAWVHLVTDAAFHKTASFAHAESEIGKKIATAGFLEMRVRTFFLAHVLAELALDAYLARTTPALLEDFYSAFAGADFAQVTHWAEAATGRVLPQLPQVMAQFATSRYLRYYVTDDGVAEGLNRLCQRARQDIFIGTNETRLERLVSEAVALMTSIGPDLLSETAAALHRPPALEN